MNPECIQERKQTGLRPGFLCLVLILGTLSACGKKGPLYLPPGMIPVLKPVPVSSEEPIVEPVMTPAIDAVKKKTSPAVVPADADKAQP